MKNIGTMLVVAHRLSTIQHADNIILLSHGKILEQGTHQELLHHKGAYHHLYTLQYNKQQLVRALPCQPAHAALPLGNPYQRRCLWTPRRAFSPFETHPV